MSHVTDWKQCEQMKIWSVYKFMFYLIKVTQIVGNNVVQQTNVISL